MCVRRNSLEMIGQSSDGLDAEADQYKWQVQRTLPKGDALRVGDQHIRVSHNVCEVHSGSVFIQCWGDSPRIFATEWGMWRGCVLIMVHTRCCGRKSVCLPACPFVCLLVRL